ncbi:hypothetical protein JW960_01145 [candidate division KSB1 bacterium]|nr:hypothetical protein [candidate division KSB1 bacterium]
MLRNIICLSAFLLLLIVTHCSKDPTGPTTVASETWLLNDVGTQNYCDLSFSKYDNGSVSVSGKWYYYFFGYRITCSFLSGSATVVDSSVTITASGTASYPPDSSGDADTSAFTLQMNGSFKAGKSRGGWEIHFADTLWEGWVDPGDFSGTIQSGSGITSL